MDITNVALLLAGAGACLIAVTVGNVLKRSWVPVIIVFLSLSIASSILIAAKRVGFLNQEGLAAGNSPKPAPPAEASGGQDGRSFRSRIGSDTWERKTDTFENTVSLSEPYTFRGIPLGITLAEFRKLPFPDANRSPKARTLCTGDSGIRSAKDYAPTVSDDQARIGVISCRYVEPREGFVGMAGDQIVATAGAAFMDFANLSYYQIDFFFSPATLSEAQLRRRLYMIVFRPREENYETIFNALSEKYGKASSITTELLKNRMGADFKNEIAFWQNGVSKILIKRMDSKIDWGLVLYSFDPIVAAVTEAGAAVTKENAKNL